MEIIWNNTPLRHRINIGKDFLDDVIEDIQNSKEIQNLYPYINLETVIVSMDDIGELDLLFYFGLKNSYQILLKDRQAKASRTSKPYDPEYATQQVINGINRYLLKELRDIIFPKDIYHKAIKENHFSGRSCFTYCCHFSFTGLL